MMIKFYNLLEKKSEFRKLSLGKLASLLQMKSAMFYQSPQIGQLSGIKNKAAIALQCKSNAKLIAIAPGKVLETITQHCSK